MIDFYFDTQNTRDGFLRNAINEWMPDDETELKTDQTSSMIEAMRQCLIDGVQPSMLRMFQQSHADTIDYREGMFQATDMHLDRSARKLSIHSRKTCSAMPWMERTTIHSVSLLSL